MSGRIAKIDQLDSLRALAVLLVVLHHYLPNYRVGMLPFSWAGVDLFFVISGYLITAILLKQKEAIANRGSIVRNFFIKRVLRLFPIYYLFLTFFAALQRFFHVWSWEPGEGIYYYTYTSNILMFLKGGASKQLYHIWSLAVEEQFYLIWPWLVLFFSNRALSRVLLTLVVASFLFKSFCPIPDLRLLTPYHFDTLGGGALIALHRPAGNRLIHLLERHARWSILLGFGLLALHGSVFPAKVVLNAAILLLTTTLVAGSIGGFGGAFGSLLDLRGLRYVGRVSYGIYLYHKPIPIFAGIAMDKTGVHVNGIVLTLASMLLALAIAHLSFILIEQRFLRLKERFDL